MKFTKYHALGNDYLVVTPSEASLEFVRQYAEKICHRHVGLGADGILYGPFPSEQADFGLRIFNSDGSEAEKSGNGLRIFSRYLWDIGLVDDHAFTLETKGGVVSATVLKRGRNVTVEMGMVSFCHHHANLANLVADRILFDNREFEYYLANVGNPHCVIPVGTLTASLALEFGPQLENAPRFANKTNVQFVKVLSRSAIQIEIWERGAGYTLASGTSSVAAAAVMHALGRCEANIQVYMPGGQLDVSIDEQKMATMTGEVCRVADGQLFEEAYSTVR